MNTAVINIKTDPKVKKKAKKLAADLGLTLSSILNGYLREFVRTKKVNFELEEEPNEKLIATFKQNEKDRAAGFVSPTFDNVEDSLKWLHDPNAKYVNGHSVRESLLEDSE